MAIKLAKTYNCSVISADSRQVYREMTIGTAKPSLEELSRVRHYFINHLSIKQDYSAGIFEREALACLQQLFLNNPVQVLAGGSGLYVHALLYGMDSMPQVDPSFRKQIIQDYQKEGLNPLQEELEKKDPEYYQTVDLNNPHRIIRALEIIRATERKYSSFRKKSVQKRPFRVVQIGLNMDREVLYDRINYRVDQMIQAGLLDEVRGLYPYKDKNPMQTVGYQELIPVIDGKQSLEDAVTLIKRNTRRYAKRQLTWFSKDKSAKWFDPQDLLEVKRFINKEIGHGV
jgi:tRNA dimethylallyltransferase